MNGQKVAPRVRSLAQAAARAEAADGIFMPVLVPAVVLACAAAAVWVAEWFGWGILELAYWPLLVVSAVAGASVGLLLVEGLRGLVNVTGRAYARVSRARAGSQLRRMVEEARLALQQDSGQDGRATALSDLGGAEAARGDLAAANQNLGVALSIAPNDGAIHNNTGIALALQATYRAAQSHLHTAAAAGCTEAEENQVRLALVRPELPDYDDLISIRSASFGPAALNNLAAAWLRIGQWDLGREALLRVQARTPGHAEAQANIGVAQFAHGDFPGAAESFAAASNASPGDPRLLSCIGAVVAAAGDPSRAKRLLTRASALLPGDLAAATNLHTLLAMEGSADSRERLRALAREVVRRDAVLHNLSCAAMQVGDYAAAAEAAAAAVELSPIVAAYHTNLGVASWRLDRVAGALPALKAAADAPESGPAASSNLGRVLMALGEADQALAVLGDARTRWRTDQALAADEATATMAAVIAHHRPDMAAGERQDFFAELHRGYAGLRAVTHAAQQLPLDVRTNMGLYHYLREEYAQAVEHFEGAARSALNQPRLEFLPGTALMGWAESSRTLQDDGSLAFTADGQDKLREAITHLSIAAAEADATPTCLHNLARCYYALGRYEEALTTVRKVLRVDDTAEAQTLAGLTAANQARVWREMVRTQALLPDARKQSLSMRAGQFLDAAVDHFRSALREDEQNAAMHGNLGLAYMLRNGEGDVESALRHWQRMRALARTGLSPRLSEFAQIGSVDHAVRARFDDAALRGKPIDPREWFGVPAPQPAEPMWIVEPVVIPRPWRYSVRDARMRRAVERLARFSR